MFLYLLDLVFAKIICQRPFLCFLSLVTQRKKEVKVLGDEDSIIEKVQNLMDRNLMVFVKSGSRPIFFFIVRERNNFSQAFLYCIQNISMM